MQSRLHSKAPPSSQAETLQFDHTVCLKPFVEFPQQYNVISLQRVTFVLEMK
jgi:hypothetical protein